MPVSYLIELKRERRKRRLNEVRVLIKRKLNGEYPDKTLEQLLGKYAYERGISLRRIREYIKTLKLAGEIPVDLQIDI